MGSFADRVREILAALDGLGGEATRFEIGSVMGAGGTPGQSKRPRLPTMESMARLGWVVRVEGRSDVWRLLPAGRSDVLGKGPK